MIFTFDYFGTIYNNKNLDIKKVINKLYDAGHEIFICTSRSKENKKNIICYLESSKIKYHKISDSNNLENKTIILNETNYNEIIQSLRINKVI